MTDEFTWTAGKEIQYTNGGMVTNSRWSASDFVAVGHLNEITFNIWSSTSTGATAGYAFYDASKEYIVGAKPECTPSAYTEHEMTLEIPTNAVYFRTTWYGSNTENFQCQGIGMVIEPTGVELNATEKESYVSGAFILEATVLPVGASSELTWSIVSGSEYLSITPDTVYNSCAVSCEGEGNAIIKVVTTEGFEATCNVTIKEAPSIQERDISERFIFEAGSVNYTNGTNNNDANYIRSNYIDVRDCTSLALSCPQTTNSSTSHGLAFYDINNKYISGKQILTGSAWSYGTQNVEVPLNAVYVRVVWFSNNHPYIPSGITEGSFTCIAMMYV